MTASLQADRARYLAEGYVVVKGVIDTAILSSINREIGELFALQLRRLGQPVDTGDSREAFKNNAVRLLRADAATYISTARLTQHLPSVHRLLVSDEIIGLLREFGIELPVIGSRPTIAFMTSDLKIPDGYHRLPAHQEWSYMQGSLDSIVLWMPTTPVKEHSNPIEFVPRSHLLGLLDTVEQKVMPTVSDARITDDKYIAIPAEPGDVVFFSSFTVHRTSEADDGLVRIALIGSFNNATEKTYVEHGYPTGFKYVNQTSLIHEGFPTLADLAAVFSAAAPTASLPRDGAEAE
jgi:ectoine hydroxylase-related dioxygenase (phytanoyl-CoA dioxygenase family)